MKCAIISPEERDDFQGITSIYLITTGGEREILKGHIALITTLREGASIRLTMPNRIERVTTAAGSFFRFSHDNAEVTTAHYSIESE